MRHRGFSLESVLFGLGIITFAVVIFVIIFQQKPVEEIDYTYKDMELSLVTSTKKYLKEGNKGEVEDGSMRLTMSELSDKGYFTKIYDPSNHKSKCEGYILIEIFAGVGFYEPYVKCGTNYMTENYR